MNTLLQEAKSFLGYLQLHDERSFPFFDLDVYSSQASSQEFERQGCPHYRCLTWYWKRVCLDPGQARGEHRHRRQDGETEKELAR